MPLRWFSGLLIFCGVSAVFGFLVAVGVLWVMLSFLVLVAVFMGHGRCVVYSVSFSPTFVRKVGLPVVFVSLFGFFYCYCHWCGSRGWGCIYLCRSGVQVVCVGVCSCGCVEWVGGCHSFGFVGCC